MSVKETQEIGKGKPGPGRPKGLPNKATALLKEAILGAAEAVGEDGRGRGKLKGYCQFLAREEPKAFAQLLGKVLPMQVTGENGAPIPVTFQTVYERSHD
jgi:hypothetical protein